MEKEKFEIYCEFCKVNVAIFQCNTCDFIFCSKCDSSIHAAKKHTNRELIDKNQIDYKNEQKRFRSEFLHTSLLTMRRKKCQILFEKLKIGLILIKSPPGSGKSFFGQLLRYYCTYVSFVKTHYIICETEKLEIFQKELLELSNLEFENLKYYNKDKIIIIIDEAQRLFFKKYESFWDKIKDISENNNLHVNILCLAAYADVRASTTSNSTPLIFNVYNTESLKFLRYDYEEFKEIFNSYKSDYPESNLFPISEEIQNEIRKISSFHPGITFHTIAYLHSNLKNSLIKDVSEVRRIFFTDHFINSIILSKSFPSTSNFLKLTELHEEMLKLILLNKYFNFSDVLSNDYRIAKELEFYGFLSENVDKCKFQFISTIIASSVINEIYKKKKFNFDPLPEAEYFSIVELAVCALKRLKKEELQKIYKFKGSHLVEDQWLFEFCIALKSIIPKKTIVIQASKEVNRKEKEKWKGELDLFVNDNFNYGYELMIEGNDTMGHLLRKFKAEKPEYFADVQLKSGGEYKFPQGAKYLVIDFREKEFKNLKKYVKTIDKQIKDVSEFHLEDNLMRVKYAKDFSTLWVNYKGKMIQEIKLL